MQKQIIARFDSDDINLRNRLKIQYDFLKNHPNVSIVGSDIIEFNPEDRYCTIKKMPQNMNVRFENYMIRNPLNHPSVMFRKRDIIKIGSI